MKKISFFPSSPFENITSKSVDGRLEIFCHPDHGTFAEKIAITADNAAPKPRHLSWDVLSLSALTA